MSLLDNKNFRFSLLIIFILICWFISALFKFDIDQIRTFLLQYPLWISGILFVLLYVITTFFIWFGPKDVFRISGAIIFGPVVSTFFVWVSEMCNAYFMFHLSRKLGREYVQQRFSIKREKFDKMKAKAEASIFNVFTLRFNPLIPFRTMDLVYGLMHIRFRKYFWPCLVASLPRVFWLQYILALVGEKIFKDAYAVYGTIQEQPFILFYSSIYFLIVLILSLIAILIKLFRRKEKPTA